jgi:hypothetical protein
MLPTEIAAMPKPKRNETLEDKMDRVARKVRKRVERRAGEVVQPALDQLSAFLDGLDVGLGDDDEDD